MKVFNVFGCKIGLRKVKRLIEDHGAAGLYHFDDKRIEIDDSLRGESLAQTELHELFHAVWDVTSLNQTSVSMDIQQIIVENFAKFLVTNFHLRKKRSPFV